ncbi:MAG: hypothetical protein ACJ77K_05155 [Bacteroidia bacterium]
MLKKISLLIAAAILSISMQAGNDKKIGSVISRELKVPAALKANKLNEKVNVQFRLQSDGKAAVLEVQTNNPELKSYILDQFPKLNFTSVTEKKEAVYFVDINFKVL